MAIDACVSVPEGEDHGNDSCRGFGCRTARGPEQIRFSHQGDNLGSLRCRPGEEELHFVGHGEKLEAGGQAHGNPGSYHPGGNYRQPPPAGVGRQGRTRNACRDVPGRNRDSQRQDAQKPRSQRVGDPPFRSDASASHADPSSEGEAIRPSAAREVAIAAPSPPTAPKRSPQSPLG